MPDKLTHGCTAVCPIHEFVFYTPQQVSTPYLGGLRFSNLNQTRIDTIFLDFLLTTSYLSSF